MDIEKKTRKFSVKDKRAEAVARSFFFNVLDYDSQSTFKLKDTNISYENERK